MNEIIKKNMLFDIGADENGNPVCNYIKKGTELIFVSKGKVTKVFKNENAKD